MSRRRTRTRCRRGAAQTPRPPDGTESSASGCPSQAKPDTMSVVPSGDHDSPVGVRPGAPTGRAIRMCVRASNTSTRSDDPSSGRIATASHRAFDDHVMALTWHPLTLPGRRADTKGIPATRAACRPCASITWTAVQSEVNVVKGVASSRPGGAQMTGPAPGPWIAYRCGRRPVHAAVASRTGRRWAIRRRPGTTDACRQATTGDRNLGTRGSQPETLIGPEDRDRRIGRAAADGDGTIIM